jgi:hypothetical protein
MLCLVGVLQDLVGVPDRTLQEDRDSDLSRSNGATASGLLQQLKETFYSGIKIVE